MSHQYPDRDATFASVPRRSPISGRPPMITALIVFGLIALVLGVDLMHSSRQRRRLAAGGKAPGNTQRHSSTNTNYAVVEARSSQIRNSSNFGG